MCLQQARGEMRAHLQRPCMFRQTPISGHHLIQTETGSRKLAYSVSGDLRAEKIFLCLPGLLETRVNFEPLLALAHTYENCCWISMDYCGRGDSDPLDAKTNYTMSVYLADIEFFLTESVFKIKPSAKRKMFLVGTSMGGILAMQLAKKLSKKIHGLILNDVSLSLYWSSLYGLYKQFDKAKNEKGFGALAPGVEPRAIKDVQLPAHFDLHYEFDLLGMHFHHLLEGFEGAMLLVHNSHSSLCPTEIAHQAKRYVPQMEIFTVQGQSHPVDWSTEVCDRIIQAVGLKIPQPLVLSAPSDRHEKVHCVEHLCVLNEDSEAAPFPVAVEENSAITEFAKPASNITPKGFLWLSSIGKKLKNSLNLGRIFQSRKPQ